MKSTAYVKPPAADGLLPGGYAGGGNRDRLPARDSGRQLDALRSVICFFGKPFDKMYIILSNDQAESYIRLVQRAFILNPVFPAGSNVLKEPKVLMHLPFRLLYKEADQCRGALREDFFAETALMKGFRFHYLKSTRGAKTPDFLLKYEDGEIVIEIGGKGKGKRQFKGIEIDRKLILADHQDLQAHQKPLFLLGVTMRIRFANSTVSLCW